MGESEVHSKELADPMEVSFEKRFGWYVVINKVTGNRIEAHNEIFNKKVLEVMNQLVYLVEYDKEQDRLHKKAMRGF